MHTRRSSARSFSIPFAALAASATLASAGASSAESREPAGVVRIEVEFFAGDRPEPTNRATVWTSKRRVRIEQRGAGTAGAPPVFLYRGDQDRLVSLSPGERTWVAIERRLLALMGGGVAARDRRTARREVDQQLENLPADQQRAFEHLLGGAPIDGKHPDEPLVVRRNDEIGAVAGMPCRRVALSRGRRLLAEGCIADWDTVGLTPDDVEVFRALARLTHDAMGSRLPIPVELVPGQPLDLVVQFGGFPLAFERAGDVPGRSAIRVASVERIATDDALFEVPAGYAERPGLSGLAGFTSLLGGSRAGGASDALGAPRSAAPPPASPDPATTSGDPLESPAHPSSPSPSSSQSTSPPSSPSPSPSRAAASTRWRAVPLHRSISLFEDPE